MVTTIIGTISTFAVYCRLTTNANVVKASHICLMKYC